MISQPFADAYSFEDRFVSYNDC